MATSVIAALHAASSPAPREKALSQALDRLVSSSLIPEIQTLLDAVFEVFRRQHQDDTFTFVNSVASAVAVCTAPPRKAELLGHLLLDHLLQWVISTNSHPDAVRTSREALLRIAQANPATVDGVLTAIDYQEVIVPALVIARPFLVAVLINSKPQSTQKLAVIHALVRIAWSDEDAKTNVASLLVSVCPLCPLSADPEVWRVYAALVSSTVDLLVGTTHHKHAETVANAILRRVLYGLEQQLSVIPLLQSLVSLSEARGEMLHTSHILFLLGSVLQHAASSAKDQSLVLRILEALLSSSPSSSSSRSVHVESLVVPLVSVLSTHSPQSSTLLQTVLDTAATVPFAVHNSVRPDPDQGHHAAHASAFLSVMASLRTAEAWLDSLFHKSTPEIQTDSATLLQQLGACLVDSRGRLRSLALDGLTRQLQLKRADRSVDDWPPAQVKLLVSTLVVLSSHKRNASNEWLSHCFQVLASVAATTTDTMKVVLRLVKKLASTSGLKPQAIHLLRLVWTQDSRVYPQLEAMLQPAEEEDETKEEDDEEMETVRMATILAVCEKDPETGVEWIGELQGFLENDRVGMAAMAVRAVRLLCVADCLELATTIKVLSVKIKKHRIQCVDDPLFLSELCAFYASCGSGGVESSSPKYAARVVDELWTLTESNEASVRRNAFQAMASFSLVVLGLRLLDDLEKRRQGKDADDEGDEEDEEDEDERTPEEVEENVNRVWGCLQAEEDGDVRRGIEAVAKRILDAECAKLPSARGGDTRVSAAATKEMKKLLPSRQQVVDASVDGPALLLAFECADVVESTAAPKRKDKRLRVVAAQVEEMKAMLKRCVDNSCSASCGLLDQVQAVEAWLSFGGKLVDRLVELATLRTPNDAAVGHTAGLMKELLTELVAELVDGGQPQRWLAIAAVTHHACGLALATSSAVAAAIEKTRGELRAQWRSAMEALRVFQDDARRGELVQWLLLALAVATPSTRGEETDADVFTVLAWLSSGACRGDGLQSALLLFVSHTSSLPRVGEDRMARRQHVKTTVDAVVGWLLRSSGSAMSTVSVCVDAPLTEDAVVLGAQINPTVQWAAALGLAQLARTLADVGRLQWLDNLRNLLHKVWDASSSTTAVGVALGQVLLESVYFHRVDGARVQQFVDTALAASSHLSVVAAAFVLRRMPSLGCVVAAADLERFLEFVSAQKGDPLASVAAGNLLHTSTGVLFVPSAPLKEVEVALDTSVVLRCVSVMDRVARAALADRRDAVVVLQRTTTLDAQVPMLPPSTLLSMSLEAVRVGRGALNAVASASVLRCVAHASRNHPLPLELSVLVLRLLSRFAMDLGVLMAAIEVAGSHASCTPLLSENLLSSTRLANDSSTVVVACVDGLASASKRLPVALLTTLLTRLFDALVENHEAGEDDGIRTAFHKWVEFVGMLVDTPPAKEGTLAATGESENDGVAKAVSAQVLVHVLSRLPHAPTVDVAENRVLLRTFAAQVLAKVPQPREAVVDTVVASARIDAHAWWRASVMLAELLRCGYVSSSSVVLRWLQQTDTVDDDDLIMDGVVADVVDAVVASAVAKKKTPLDVNEPWILELLDIAGKGDCGRSKRVMLWSIVDALIAWGELRTHEVFVLAGDVSRVAARRESIAGSLPPLVVEALACRRRDRLVASEAIVKQLWTKSDEASVGLVLRRELHVAASNTLLSPDSESEVVRELSVL